MYMSKTFFMILLFFASIGFGLLTLYLSHIISFKLPHNVFTAILLYISIVLWCWNFIGAGIAMAISTAFCNHSVKSYKEEYYQKLLERQSQKDDNEYYDDY